MTNNPNFRGYTWEGLPTTDQTEAESFNNGIDWDAFCTIVSKLYDDVHCTMDPQITVDGRDLVRIVHFIDGTRWVAKFRIPFEHTTGNGVDRVLPHEIDCMQLVKTRTEVPVPTVHAYTYTTDNDIGGSFMLTEYLSGNPLMNLRYRVPMSPKHRKAFYSEMAGFQAEISSLTFPKIGTVTRREDGTWDVGPLRVLGGPFDTVSEYLEAWADRNPFNGYESLEEKYGEELGKKLKASILAFRDGLKKLAATIPTRNHGPFPLIHPDFGFGDVVVNDDYKVLGVMGWEGAHSGPWETVHFPTAMNATPAPLADVAWYKYNFVRADDHLKRKRMKEYVDQVRRAERTKNLPPTLSAVLSDEAGQDLAEALHLYNARLPDLYSKVIEAHHERWSGGKKDAEAA